MLTGRSTWSHRQGAPDALLMFAARTCPRTITSNDHEFREALERSEVRGVLLPAC
jgi:hypothetical protein